MFLIDDPEALTTAHFPKGHYPSYDTMIVKHDEVKSTTGERYPQIQLKQEVRINQFGEDGFKNGDKLMFYPQPVVHRTKIIVPKPFPVTFVESFLTYDDAELFQKV